MRLTAIIAAAGLAGLSGCITYPFDNLENEYEALQAAYIAGEDVSPSTAVTASSGTARYEGVMVMDFDGNGMAGQMELNANLDTLDVSGRVHSIVADGGGNYSGQLNIFDGNITTGGGTAQFNADMDGTITGKLDGFDRRTVEVLAGDVRGVFYGDDLDAVAATVDGSFYTTSRPSLFRNFDGAGVGVRQP